MTEAEARQKAREIQTAATKRCGNDECERECRDLCEEATRRITAALLSTDTAGREEENRACEEIASAAAENYQPAVTKDRNFTLMELMGAFKGGCWLVREDIAARRRPAEGGVDQ